MQTRNYYRERRYRLAVYLRERFALSHPHQAPGAYQTPGPYGQPGPYQPGPPQQSGYPNSGPLFQISLWKHTGMVIMWQNQTVRCTGTLEQCEQAYRDAQTHCLTAGWWSVASFFVMNWVSLFYNMNAIRKVRNIAKDPHAVAQQQQALVHHQQALVQHQQAMAQHQQAAAQHHQGAQQQSGTPAAWYPDPSGQPGQRYWDGTNWTHWTNPPGHS